MALMHDAIEDRVGERGVAEILMPVLDRQLAGDFSGGADPTARLMLTMLGAFAEFERELIRERQREGIAIAKAKGKYKGRKRAPNAGQIQELREMAGQGLPKADLARAYDISRETVYQYLRPQANVPP